MQTHTWLKACIFTWLGCEAQTGLGTVTPRMLCCNPQCCTCRVSTPARCQRQWPWSLSAFTSPALEPSTAICLRPCPYHANHPPPATSFLLSHRQAVGTASVLPPKTVLGSSQIGTIRWDLPQLPVISPLRLPTSSAVSFSLPLSN